MYFISITSLQTNSIERASKEMSHCPDFTITNVKFSIKIQNWWNLLELYNHCYSLIGNCAILLDSKLILKIPNQSKRLIIFPKKRGSSFQHINITGVSSFDQVEETLEYVKIYLNLEDLTPSDIIIDNIWAKSQHSL